MKIVRIDEHNMLNGDGLRTVVWCSGCEHHCPHCQNPETWDYDYGHEITPAEEKQIIDSIGPKWISGVTFSGGDPLYPKNRNEVLRLCKLIKIKEPTKTIWLYTGYTIEKVRQIFPEILKYIDVLVDGPFIQKLAKIDYHWAGSTNQRVIYLKEDVSDAKKMEK